MGKPFDAGEGSGLEEERVRRCQRISNSSWKGRGTSSNADRSANDGDRVWHGFGYGDLRGARQELAEGTQIGGRTAEHIYYYLELHYMLLTPFEKKCVIFLWKPLSTAWTKGPMS